MKKFIALLLVSVIAVSLVLALPSPVSAAEVLSSGSCGDNVTYTLTDDGVLTISGTGPMTEFTPSNVPWVSYRSSITSVIVGDNVTSIGAYSFWFCSNITSVSLPDSITSIGASAFQSVTNLRELVLPKKLVLIGDSAFGGTTAISDFVIPSSVTSIGSFAFNGSAMESITFLSAAPPVCVTHFLRPTDFDGPIFVYSGSLSAYKNSSYFSALAHLIVPIGSNPTFNKIPLGDYVLSSSTSSTSSTIKYGFSDYPGSAVSGNFNCGFIDSVCYTSSNSSNKDPVPWYSSAFYVADIIEDATSLFISASVSYTATGIASYNGSRRLSVFYFDADGNYISSQEFGYVYGSKHSSGSVTYTFTGNPTFPLGTCYIMLNLDVSGFAGLTVSQISASFSLEVVTPPIVEPLEPVITSDFRSLDDTIVLLGEELTLSVSAFAPDAGTLSYQWYCNTSNNFATAVLIEGATSASFAASFDQVETLFYWCVVTNKIGRLSASVRSSSAMIHFYDWQFPVITRDLLSVPYTYFSGDYVYLELLVDFPGTDYWYQPEYRWYSCSNKYGQNPKQIDLPLNYNDYGFTAEESGAFFFYCEVTHSFGGKFYTVRSAIATVYIDYDPESGSIGSSGFDFEEYVSISDKVLSGFSAFAENLAIPIPEVAENLGLSSFASGALQTFVGDRSFLEWFFGLGIATVAFILILKFFL